MKKNVYTRAILPGHAEIGNEPSTGCEVAVVIPAKDFEKFKDSLTSTTFVLETHDEDICRRAFSSRNIDTYTELFKAEEGSDAAAPVSPRAAAAAAGGKSMSKQMSKQPSAAEEVEPPAPKRTISTI